MNAMQEELDPAALDAAAAGPTQRPAPAPPAGEAGWGRERVVRDPRWKSPALTGLLSLMPGLGQVYVGYYRLGFVHILVWGSTIAWLASDPVPGLTPLVALFMSFFYLYNIVDAVRRATLYNHALAGIRGVVSPSDVAIPARGGSIVGGVLLVGVGALLLSNTLFDVSFEWLESWWPVAPILGGLYLVFRGVWERSGDQRP